MTELFEAWHCRVREGDVPDKTDGQQDAKPLGDYTNRAGAEAAIKQRAGEEGFRDWSSGFRIEVVPVDEDLPSSADAPLARYYRVWHFRIGPDDEDDEDDPAKAATQVACFPANRTPRRQSSACNTMPGSMTSRTASASAAARRTWTTGRADPFSGMRRKGPRQPA